MLESIQLVSRIMKIAIPWYCMLIVLLLGGASAATATADSRWHSSGYLVDSFVEVALRHDYSTRQNPLRKWSAPVNYFIVHRVGDDELHSTLIQTHFRHLAQITGLAIQPAQSQAAANFLVVLTSEDRLEVDLPLYLGAGSAQRHEALFRHNVCLATFATERKGSIVRAVAMIPVDAARARGDLVSCMIEELTHAMGLPNDSPKLFPSIFSRKSSHIFLTGLDSLLLKMLYDPRLRAGMSEKLAWPILQVIAGEYERDRRFATADQLAAESGLAAMNR